MFQNIAQRHGSTIGREHTESAWWAHVCARRRRARGSRTSSRDPIGDVARSDGVFSEAGAARRQLPVGNFDSWACLALAPEAAAVDRAPTQLYLARLRGVRPSALWGSPARRRAPQRLRPRRRRLSANEAISAVRTWEGKLGAR